jgi:hypothetical protein
MVDVAAVEVMDEHARAQFADADFFYHAPSFPGGTR